MTEYERSAWSAITSGGHRGDGDEHAHQCIDRPAVWDRTPAVPASTATTADHLSGRQMNPVKGRGPVTSDRSIQPTARAIRASTAVIAIATRKPLDQEACRVLDEVRSSGRQAHRQGGDHTELRAHDHPADHENGGVGNHGHRGNGGGQRQERIERPRPARFAIGMVHHGVPHDRVIRCTRSGPLGGASIGRRGGRHIGDNHRPVFVQALGAEPAQDVRRCFTGYLALHQVPRGSDPGPVDHQHIRSARVSIEMPDHRIGAAGGTIRRGSASPDHRDIQPQQVDRAHHQPRRMAPRSRIKERVNIASSRTASTPA